MPNLPDCERCGDAMSAANKNTAGHYRDKCWSCIRAVAAPEDPRREEPP